ncbi:NtaA/DmoA family FMN-dependent monooxygenase [Roseomonas sp. 18066]|uniref:NtaA/DmoA family FMN-dependent monooxygenase n=1 Tax=Roseomonas sp. 18066 TaxID=2681412 RepID=UPI0013569325|nr:NtaA/DmoA family FMN-dependent monooxygenase [Roseomonas sp. 18066]
MPRRMRLVAYLKTGPTANHAGGWRHPAASLDDIFDPARYEQTARLLEQACFDAAFFADTVGVPDIYKGSYATYLKLGGQISYLDPMAVLPMMMRVTRHLGLGATLSTSFHHPHHLARILGSMDILSGGRMAWNVVTSATDFEARNFGGDGIPPKEQRYDRGDEVLEACCALWDGWDADAFVMDRAAGIFIDPSKVRYANYDGRHVSSRGPLSVPRSPQGRPVLMQAGSSPRGREFATRWAELIFSTPAGREDAQAYYADIRARLAAAGREAEGCAILPATAVVLGETQSIAEDRAAYLESLINPELVVAANSNTIGLDLSQDRPQPVPGSHQGIQGSRERVAARAQQEGISFAEAAKKPRRLLVGTAESVADQMEDWFSSGACDGFVLWPTHSPGMFEDFCRMVVPVLQKRGLVQKNYAEGTLREKLNN